MPIESRANRIRTAFDRAQTLELRLRNKAPGQSNWCVIHQLRFAFEQIPPLQAPPPLACVTTNSCVPSISLVSPIGQFGRYRIDLLIAVTPTKVACNTTLG